MKLHDLAAPQKTQQIAKVMESHFGSTVAFDKLTPAQAQVMLRKVRGLISEQRRQPGFHSSEQNPAYLKLVMMEQGLAAAATAPAQTPQQTAAMNAMRTQTMKKQLDDEEKSVREQIKAMQDRLAAIQKQKNMPMGESKIARRLREASEVQQAQVVLASKDMVDQVQKMIETATSIQFKDLPALVDQIRNEIGYDQATQFNQDATTALSGLVQNLQQSKGQLEGALGVVTGQAPQIPGQDLNAAPAADLGADLGADVPPVDGEEEVDLDVDVDAEEEPSSLATTLGRGKR